MCYRFALGEPTSAFGNEHPLPEGGGGTETLMRRPRDVSSVNRRYLALALLCCCVASAGCGALLGGGPLSFSAEPVSVSSDAAGSNGYEVVADSRYGFERSVDVAGQSRTVNVSGSAVTLQRGGNAAPGTAVVLSVPTVEVPGAEISLVEQFGPVSLLGQAAGEGSLQRGEQIGQRQVSILGSERTVEIYSGTATQEGQDVDVRIHVATFTHDGDSIVAVAVTPTAVAGSGTDEAVLGLFRGIER
jgi:hypothetical protein